MRKRTAAKKAEIHQKGLDSTKEKSHNDHPNPKWWEQKYEGLGGYGDKYEWNWWSKTQLKQVAPCRGPFG